jgi:chromosome segregation ATPase
VDNATPRYPKRQAYFAHRYCRLLTKTCAAQEIGPIAFVLCVTIAHTEDAKRYAAEMQRWQKLEAEHATITAPLVSKAVTLEKSVKDANAAGDKLRASYKGPLLDEVAKLEGEQAAIHRKIAAAERTASHFSTELSTPLHSGMYRPENAKKSLEKQQAAAAAEIAELQKQLTPLTEQQAELEAQMLLP